MGVMRGNVMKNVDPVPTWLSAQMTPPWASTIPLVMKRPRPRPLRAVSSACQ